jgi:formate dehydrogenase assembly factor FdhD
LLLVVNLIEAGLMSTPAHPKPLATGFAAAGGIAAVLAGIAYLVGLAVAHAATVFAV